MQSFFFFHESIWHISLVEPIPGLNRLFTNRHHYRFHGNGIFSYTERQYILIFQLTHLNNEKSLCSGQE